MLLLLAEHCIFAFETKVLKFTKLWWFSCIFCHSFSFQQWFPILSTQHSIPLPRGRLVTQGLKKKYAFLLRQKYCIHSLELGMQNQGMISVLPNSQGYVLLHLKMLLDN